MTTIQIRSILGKVIFEHTSKHNTIKETIEKAISRGANLRGVDLEGANLRGVDLRGVDLEGANLRGANLEGANLRGVDLEGANLIGANLIGVDLEGANLIGVDLEGANLRGANLRDVDLEGANLRGANLRDVDLEGAKNYYSFMAYDTSKRIVHCVKHKDTWMVSAGCFWGTLQELEKKVLESHKSKFYLTNIQLLKNLK